MEKVERRTLSVSEAARVLGISRAHAHDCVRSGELPSITLGRRGRASAGDRGAARSWLLGRLGGARMSAAIALQRSCQRGSQTCIADALTLTSGGGGLSC